MPGILILALIIFAVHEYRKHRRDFGNLGCGKDGDQWWKDPEKTRRWTSDFQTRLGRKFEYKAERFERKIRRKFDHETSKYGVDTADPAPPAEEQPQFKTDAARQAYERARKRAAAETGFYVHLMWYAVVMGFLFFLNLLTTSFQWWLFPAIGWGFGLASHFAAVFGWRWIHERVFAPAIKREVQREVTIEKEALRTEKQASLDELTATFAHEIRNPIAAAKSLVQQMGEDPTSHENVEYAKVALDELARVERSVSHLLKYAKEEDYDFENVNLASVLDGALTQMRSKLESNSVRVMRSYLSGPIVRADADKLRQVFSNVIDNAIDAMAEVKSDRRIEVAIVRGSDGMATVHIRDNGCGIPTDKLPKIFNPFYTSKETGTGLGLGVAKKVIDSHRGTIEVTSHVEQGTEFEISIPLADALRDESGQAAASPAQDDAQPQPAAAAAPVSLNGSSPATAAPGTAAMAARGRQ
jgi:signal transduction histidine kinase